MTWHKETQPFFGWAKYVHIQVNKCELYNSIIAFEQSLWLKPLGNQIGSNYHQAWNLFLLAFDFITIEHVLHYMFALCDKRVARQITTID